MRALAVAAAVAATVATGAGAQGGGSSRRVLDGFAACRAVAAADARLACFDKAAGALETAVARREVTIVDREDVRKTRRSLFGFTLPRIPLFGDGGKDETDEAERKAFTEINSTVRAARQSGYGRYEITLDDEDGAVWQTTEPLPDVPRAGAKVRIRKGAMGAYFINVDGRSARGRRIR